MSRTLCIAVVLSLTVITSAYAQAPSAAGAESAGVAPGFTNDAATPAAQPLPSSQPFAGVEPFAAPELREPVAAGELWQSSLWWLVIPAWLIVFVTIALAVFTARLLKSTTAILDDTRSTSRKELRSYVALDEIFFSEGAEAAAGTQKLRIRNYGQTPAFNMSIWCERASHLPQEGVKPFYDAAVIDGQLLHPVQAFTVGLAAAPLYRIGKPGFFTYGRIIYRDIFEQWWVTKFCFRHEGDGSFVPHGDYNSEDGPFDKAPA